MDYGTNCSKRSNAIVIGGSFAGLASTKILSKYFDQVILIERGALQSTTEPRRHVPQGGHVHAVLLKAIEIIDPSHQFFRLSTDDTLNGISPFRLFSHRRQKLSAIRDFGKSTTTNLVIVRIINFSSIF